MICIALALISIYTGSDVHTFTFPSCFFVCAYASSDAVVSTGDSRQVLPVFVFFVGVVAVLSADRLLPQQTAV